ncbi:MAG: AbrB/MazE/SpoVT family DNA-binding domain-containing protein [Polyangiaceae bacterium]
MSSSTVSSKGQVTIPKRIREALRLDTGDRVRFVIRDDGVVELVPETVDLMDLVGVLEPADGRQVTIDGMNDAVERAIAGRDAKRRK